jgi:NADH:ubiquinone oxidoreductase subunit 5 (subunit L)/multisubunit Na+/H+ antiporter MnhA subunit
MVSPSAWAPLIPLFPLLGSVLILLSSAVKNWRRGAGRLPEGHASTLSLLAVLISCGGSVAVLVEAVSRGTGGVYHPGLPWISAGMLQVRAGWLVDAPRAMMLVGVSTAALVVQVCARRSMAQEARAPRFFGALNLLTAATLLLVLASDRVLSFAAWELAAAASYLLMGYWLEQPAATQAAGKALGAARTAGKVLGAPMFQLSRGVNLADGYLVDGATRAVGATVRGLSWLSDMFDRHLVDGAANRVGRYAQAAGNLLRAAQTGQVGNYLLVAFIGVVALIYFLASSRLLR